MRNLTSPKWIIVKGLLLLFAGASAAALLFRERPTLKVGFLLAVAIWSCCRFYFFMFSVIQQYVDPKFRFSSLLSFLLSLIRR